MEKGAGSTPAEGVKGGYLKREKPWSPKPSVTVPPGNDGVWCSREHTAFGTRRSEVRSLSPRQ